MSSIPTPVTDFLDFENVYEPAEDSFLLLDGLESELEWIRDLRPAICVELGSGSGIITVGLSSVLKHCSFFLACDINEDACQATKKTTEVNSVSGQVDIVRTNGLQGLSLVGKVDLLMCNPPYVATTEEEAEAGKSAKDIYASWAGGSSGRSLTDKLIKMLPSILSASGAAYILLEQCNRPEEVMKFAEANGLKTNVVVKRRAGREMLSVIKLVHGTA